MAREKKRELTTRERDAVERAGALARFLAEGGEITYGRLRTLAGARQRYGRVKAGVTNGKVRADRAEAKMTRRIK